MNNAGGPKKNKKVLSPRTLDNLLCRSESESKTPATSETELNV